MKTYRYYLMENEKKYGFRVKMAHELAKDEMEALQRGLARWNLEAISEPKRLPVAEQHSGFEHIKNTDLYIVDLVVNYPCTPQEIQACIHECVKVPLSHVMVLTPEQEVLAAPVLPAGDQPILTSDYPQQKAPQLLADLANALKMKTIEHPFAVKPTEKGQTTNDLPQNNTGPLGTHKPKLPAARTGRI